MRNNGTFNMHGGSISKNEAISPDDDFGEGGGVYVEKGEFTLYKGTISENDAILDGGGSNSGINIRVEPTENGTTTVNKPGAGKGDSVIITAKPDEGYELDDLKVTDQSGKEIPVKDLGDNRYSFVSPGGKITVKAAYISGARTFLPMRFVAENLDATVLWDKEERRTIIIPNEGKEVEKVVENSLEQFGKGKELDVV